MSLATRCPACGTIFRVVQDQLRVSQGWVRCGRCTEAFNALESMVDLPPPRVPTPAAPAAEPESEPSIEAPGAVQAPAAGSTSIDLPAGMALIASDGAIGEAADVPRVEPGAVAHADPDAVSAAASDPTHGEPSSPGPTPGAAAVAGAIADAGPVEVHGHAGELHLPSSDPMSVTAFAGAPAGAGAAEAAPSFIVEAERAERWRRPGVRLALGVGVLASALALAAQATYTFRDRVAASAPVLKPVLAQACALLDCRIGDVRQIDALSVETSSLVRVEGTSVHRLAVTLRNRADIDIAAPALDLSLTDPQGQPIARRVLQMSDLDLPLRVLKAGTELPIQVPLGIGDRQVSGYTVEIFYP